MLKNVLFCHHLIVCGVILTYSSALNISHKLKTKSKDLIRFRVPILGKNIVLQRLCWVFHFCIILVGTSCEAVNISYYYYRKGYST